MTKNDLFNEIISILKNDYAGYQDKLDWVNLDAFRSKMDAYLDDTSFLELTKTMLRGYKDNHLQIIDTSETTFSNGFSTRRYQKSLYITEVIQEQSLFKGDAITHLDGRSIPNIEADFKDYFYCEDTNRQEWRAIIKNFTRCTVIRGSESFEFELQRYTPLANQAEYSLNLVSGVPLIKLTDFANEAAVLDLITTHKDLLDECENLIIDVRTNGGGSDTSYFPLLDYLFEQKTSLNQVMENSTMSVLYSERSCDLRVTMFNAVLLEQPNLPEEIKSYLLQEIDNYKKYRGQGFIEVNDDFDYTIDGHKTPKNVYIISDQYCGSSGDSFVLLAKKSPKVTVVGRNTMGVLDYSNVCFAPLSDNLQLMYPTSRMGSVDLGQGIDNIGVAPDIQIEWTPNHLNRDIDLDFILELIGKRAKS